MSRSICIHGHFYQPPRENAWLETVEIQSSARPYHDWNERITAECYRPNAAARILGAQDRIAELVNNYELMSFNVGPTLLSWLAERARDVYDAIIEADRRGTARFSGHGSALAQAYNHLIMPLASPADRRTQVIWGIRDFEHHFGRRPEGMWLPETAACTDSLEALAEQGIAFTILAPHQLAADDADGRHAARHATRRALDPRRPYRIELPSGREITAFIYHGGIAQAAAFEKLLDSGASFIQRLRGAFAADDHGAQLVHIATDGETYGHHHRFGEMALAFALRSLESDGDIHLTNYGEYLERHPATSTARLVENTSWSCVHGVGRWREDCGCHSGANAEWNQRWRAPLRRGLDELRDAAHGCFEREGAALFHDPPAARDDYIDVILERTPERLDRFLRRHARADSTPADARRALKLMEMQRHAMLMFTSCGWFFDDITGIETRQILQYAGRVCELCLDVCGADLEPALLGQLDSARSNHENGPTGREVYREAVAPRDDVVHHLAARCALRGLHESIGRDAEPLLGHEVRVLRLARAVDGPRAACCGSAVLKSRATLNEREIEFAAWTADGDVACLGRLIDGDPRLADGDAEGRARELVRGGFDAAMRLATSAATRLHRLADLPAELRHWRLNARWPHHIRAMYEGECTDWREVEALYAIADDLGAAAPEALTDLVHTRKNAALWMALGETPPDLERIGALLHRCEAMGVPLDAPLLETRAAPMAAAAAAALLDDVLSGPAVATLADILRRLRPLLRETDLRRLLDACRRRWKDDATIASHTDAVAHRAALGAVCDALGLRPPTG